MLHRFRIASVLLVALWPAGALAQNSASSGSTSTVTVSYNGDNVENQSRQLILTASQCRNNVDVGFLITRRVGGSNTNIPTGSVLEVWESATGTDCKLPENREDTADGQNCSTATCNRIASRTVNNPGTDLSISIPAQDLFGRNSGSGSTTTSDGGVSDGGDGGVSDGGVSDGGVEGGAADAAQKQAAMTNPCGTGTRKITLVVVSSQQCRDAQMDQLSGENRATFDLRGDLGAPTDVELAKGNSTLAASWTADGARMTDNFQIYIDTNAGPNCRNALLNEGMDPTDADNVVEMEERLVRESSGSESYSILTDQLGIELGDSVAVWVTTRDTQTEDRSPLSERACAERIFTEGPLEAVESATGRKVDSCSNAGRGAGGGTAALLGLLGIWLVARRRESRA